MNDISKRVHIYLAIGLLETVRDAEETANAKSARALSLKNLIDNSCRVGDFYGIADFKSDVFGIANKLMDDFGDRVIKAFAPHKQVTRNEKGRFVAVTA